MAQVDMNKIKEDTVNSTKIEELKETEQAKASTQLAELTNNTSEKLKDTNETEKHTQAETKEEKSAGKVVVRYISGGIWKDSKGKLWATENKAANILSERQYSAAEYEKRDDIKFMVQYGSMKVTNVE